MDSVLTPGVKIYTRTWTATDACSNTSSHIQIIRVNPVSASVIDTSVFDCQGGITVGGQVFVESGTYQIVVPNSYGCDSVINLDLIVRICDTIPIGEDITLFDTLPVQSSVTICDLSLPPGDDIVVAACTGGTTGTTDHGTWTIDPVTNCLLFTSGSVVGNDTLCFSACDTITQQCNTTTVIITVTGLPPIANDDCVEETEKNEPLIINVLENDTDPDQDGLIIRSVISDPQFGTVSIDQRGQSITYTPNRNFCGRDTFYYEVCDTDDGCDTALVCIKVTCECEYPQVITPNNDGFNDYLFFPCISQIDGVRLLVWHRWGLVMYEDNNYKNDWNGTLKGELLPAGTYWYSIEYFDPELQEEVKSVNYFMIIN
jgi:gliding motility-associated-like protein